MSIQAIEPVLAPPPDYMVDVAVGVEFAHPALIGLRCAERGAKFLGLPGINSTACANAQLITMTDPCLTLTAGSYAHGLCLASRPVASGSPLAQRVSFEADQPARTDRADDGAWRVEFVSPARLAARCDSRNLVVAGPADGPRHCVAERTITVANPCKTSSPGWYERTLCHELAHANGWPADHSDAPLARLPLARHSPEARALRAEQEL